jgi:hypothetical protein
VHVIVSLTALTTACASTEKAGLSPRDDAIKNSAAYPVKSNAEPEEFLGRMTNSLVSPL